MFRANEEELFEQLFYLTVLGNSSKRRTDNPVGLSKLFPL